MNILKESSKNIGLVMGQRLENEKYVLAFGGLRNVTKLTLICTNTNTTVFSVYKFTKTSEGFE